MKYIAVKIVDAIPMDSEVALSKNYKVVTEEKEGYEVTYEEGYKSWCPKSVFEKHNKPISGCTFGQAIEALKQGKLVCREGWNGKGMFIMKQIPAEIPLEVIPKMQSVQQSAKNILVERGTTLKYCNQMLIIKQDGTADSWVSSSSDIFAEDWVILD